MTGPSGQAPVRLGVLGCAEFALRRMLPALAQHPDIEVAAVASRRPETARATAARFGGVPVDGYERLFATVELDAVYVPLPNALHAPWVVRALYTGRHVLAEKPLTTSGELTRAVRRAEEKGLALVENFLFVHHPQRARVRELVRDDIGPLRRMSAEFAIPPRPAQDIRHRPDLGGGALLDVGVYPLRTAQYFLGTGLEVAAATLREGPAGVDVEGAVVLHRPADGVRAHLSFGMDHAYASRYTLRGAHGTVRVDRAFTPPADHRPEVTLERDATTRRVDLPAADQCAAAVTAFVRAVRTPASARAATEYSVDLARLTDEVRAVAG